MGVYRSRNRAARWGAAEIAATAFRQVRCGRRGYRAEEVDAFVVRVAAEVAGWQRRVDLLSIENDQLRHALRAWRTEPGPPPSGVGHPGIPHQRRH